MLVGFAAERGEADSSARREARRKALDLVVYNDVSRTDIGFDATDNEVVLVTRAGEREVAQGAEGRRSRPAILDEAERLLEERRGGRQRPVRPTRPSAETVERLVENLARVMHAPQNAPPGRAASSPRGT